MTHTTADISSAKDQLLNCIRAKGDIIFCDIALASGGGSCATEEVEYMFAMYDFLNAWQQTPSGNPAPYYNAGTAAELSGVIKWVTNNCSC